MYSSTNSNKNQYIVRQKLALLKHHEQERRKRIASFLRSKPGVHPQSNTMGVEFYAEEPPLENYTLSWHIDYLRITAWIDFHVLQTIYLNIMPDLGGWVDLGHGGRFYKSVLGTRLGCRIYKDPGNEFADRNQTTIEFPGEACQYLGFDRLRSFFYALKVASEKVSCTRIDLAWTGVKFTPRMAYDAFREGNVRTLVKRVHREAGKSSLKWWEDPYQKRENGVEGCSMVAIGNRESTRYMRIYDKHGDTRCEVEFKEEKALQVMTDLFTIEDGNGSMQAIYSRAVGHLRDYIDFKCDWWVEFTGAITRAYAKLSGVKPAEIDAERVASWIYRQVAAALSVFADVYGLDLVNAAIVAGRVKRGNNKKYRMILSEGVIYGQATAFDETTI